MVVIFVILTILLLTECLYFKKLTKTRNAATKVDMADVKFKTGDLILTRYDHTCHYHYNGYAYFNLAQFIFCREIFTHVGVIVVRDDKVLVYQIGPGPMYDHATDNYVSCTNALTDLDNYISHYLGDVFYIPVSDDAVVNTNALDEYIKENKCILFNPNLFIWIAVAIKPPLKYETPGKQFCTQLAANVIKTIGLDPDNKLYPIQTSASDIYRFAMKSPGYKHEIQLINNPYNDYMNVGTRFSQMFNRRRTLPVSIDERTDF